MTLDELYQSVIEIEDFHSTKSVNKTAQNKFCKNAVNFDYRRIMK